MCSAGNRPQHTGSVGVSERKDQGCFILEIRGFVLSVAGLLQSRQASRHDVFSRCD